MGSSQFTVTVHLGNICAQYDAHFLNTCANRAVQNATFAPHHKASIYRYESVFIPALYCAV